MIEEDGVHERSTWREGTESDRSLGRLGHLRKSHLASESMQPRLARRILHALGPRVTVLDPSQASQNFAKSRLTATVRL